MGVFEGWKVTSPYGYRTDPINGSRSFHTGIDLVKYHRYPIPAFVGGVVLFAGEGVAGTGFGGYGNVVALRDDKGYVHCYCHLDSVAVQKGQKLSKGDIVGYQGTTGRSTGSHLHYEVRAEDAPSYGYGSHVDPSEYLEKYFEGEDEMLKEQVRELESQVAALKGECQTLLNTAEAHVNEINTLKALLADKSMPEWFSTEFGEEALNGVVDTPQGPNLFWRLAAVAFRLRKKG
ncbi:peptidoglycan DD-metalloendopeptidase family protein [Paenibacillus elgii]|uniref:peptidoglycan DD-metalloendopeptidase family protein n=1 Tax=Paenibacillus elgii TaxID=189691 RepID=UPI00203C77C7|nr:peptidoglycan DD-metalloendopeptidase family protein [Paenibacillus elgii]MCM3272621.1 peptidoglycan DD-metalloendopeptidase family protein [Paenibacillus elgii]